MVRFFCLPPERISLSPVTTTLSPENIPFIGTAKFVFKLDVRVTRLLPGSPGGRFPMSLSWRLKEGSLLRRAEPSPIPSVAIPVNALPVRLSKSGVSMPGLEGLPVSGVQQRLFPK